MSPQEFRSHFPILRHKVHLGSCSQGALSFEVEAAFHRYLDSLKKDGVAWGQWVEEAEAARRLFAKRVGAADDEVALVASASEGAFQAVSTLDFSERNEILTTDLEFPSIAHVWLSQEKRGARVRFVPGQDATVDPEAYRSAISERTALVSLPVASYRNGFRLPVEDLARTAREKGAKVFVDAYQAAGVMPVSARELGADYLVTGALKYLLGVPGIAFLFARKEVAEVGEPLFTGWFGRKNPSAFDPRTLDWGPGALRFQTGTQAIPAAYAARAALTLLDLTDPLAVWQHVLSLGEELQTGLVEEGISLLSPTEASFRGPQVTVRTERAEAMGAFLAERDIIASPRGEGLRLSLHYYNDRNDIAMATQAVKAFRDEMGP